MPELVIREISARPVDRARHSRRGDRHQSLPAPTGPSADPGDALVTFAAVRRRKDNF